MSGAQLRPSARQHCQILPIIFPGPLKPSLSGQVTALLVELAEMRRAEPGAKAVVFSAWGRLLKLVAGALQANGLPHVSLAGAQPDARAAALHRFLTDPDCAVILIVLSTGGACLPSTCLC